MRIRTKPRPSKWGRRADAVKAQAAMAAVRAVTPDITSAFDNEKLTRLRVGRCEGVILRGFWGRLRWLFLGR
jgi:hypothetical protein